MGFEMANLDDFSSVFQSTWVGLRNQRVKYEDSVSKLEKYRGSAGFEKDVAEAEKTYRDAIEAIQCDARCKFGSILERMHSSLEPVSMDVPSEEAVRVLQVLSMREHLTTSDVLLAAESLRGSDAALATLQDLAKRDGLVVPAKYMSKGEQRRKAFEALRDSANGLLNWSGADGTSVRMEWVKNRNPMAGGDPSKLNPWTFTAAKIADMGGADMQGMRYTRPTYELCRELVGDDVQWSEISALD